MDEQILEKSILELVSGVAELKNEVGNIKEITNDIKANLILYEKKLVLHEKRHGVPWTTVKKMLVVISTIVGSGGVYGIIQLLKG